MTRGLLTFLFWALSTSVVWASAGTVVFWTGVSDDDRTLWEKEGYVVASLSCAPSDATCVSQKLVALPPAEKKVLIAGPESSAAVAALYAGGLSTEQLSGVAMMRADTPVGLDISASANPPKLSVFVEKTDPAEIVTPAQSYVSAFRKKGVKSSLKFFDPGMMDTEPVHPAQIIAVSHFMGYAPPSKLLMKTLTAYELWPQLGHNNDAFLAEKSFLSKKPMGGPVRDFLKQHFRQGPFLANQWAFESYVAFDLLAYRDAVAPGAKYVSFNTRLGQFMAFDLDQYAAYEPEIVVTIDNEDNMYQFAWYYWNDLMYSWDTKVPNISAKPLGPALVFTKPMPEELDLPFRQRTALHLKGISFSNEDPLAKMKSYPPRIQEVITKANECIYCHSIDGVGGQNYHLNAYTAQPQGGVALPLEHYREEVMREFLFNQEAVAAKVGLAPNPIDPDYVQEFYGWVSDLKGKQEGN